MRYLGLLLSLLVISMGVLNGGSISLFIDTPSVLVVVVITLGCSIFSGLRPFRVLGVGLSSQPQPNDAAYAAQGLQEMRGYMMASGWIGFMFGGVIMGVNIDSVNVLGPGLALMLMTVIYATVGSYVILKPMQHRLERVVEGG